MHADEIQVTSDLVARLLLEQHPDLAGHPVERVASSGTMNAMFRIPGDRVVRLPLVRWGAEAIQHEATWMPRLASSLSVRIPNVIAMGAPSAHFPCPWLVLDWLPGTNPHPVDVATIWSPGAADRLADDLGGLLRELHRIDIGGAPAATRGGPLMRLDEDVRGCLSRIEDLVDVVALVKLWDLALDAPAWHGQPVWLHADLLAANVLVQEGRLTGVIDWGAAGVGDPACDAMAAWSILPSSAHDRFRGAAELDAATWTRGMGWMLAQAAIALPYYRESNAGMTEAAIWALTHLVAG